MAGFYDVKIAALLHDPPWKPWVVSSSVKVAEAPGGTFGRILAKVNGNPAGVYVDECKDLVVSVTGAGSMHEADAIAMVQRVLSIVDKDLANSVESMIRNRKSAAAEADKLASSLDRWMLTVDPRWRQLKLQPRRLLNILEPRFSVEVKSCLTVDDVAKACRYVRELQDMLGHLKGVKPGPLRRLLILHVLYLVLEPLWYRVCGSEECAPLADTRAPTHTVFDHVYASASMANWTVFGRGRPCGLLAKVDLAGVQDFISAARKTRDLWAGSWLASVIPWTAVRDAVILLGPDIILSPYTGANHFYIASLLHVLNKLATKSSGIGELRDAVGRLAEQAYLWQGVANQPVAPATLFLALPCGCNGDEDKWRDIEEAAKALKKLGVVDENVNRLIEALRACEPDKVEEYFRSRFNEAWKKVAKAVLEAYRQQDVELELDKLVDGLLKTLEEAGVLEAPRNVAKDYLRMAVETAPAMARVTAVDVGDAYDRLRKELSKLECSTGSKECVPCLDRLGVDNAARRMLLGYLMGHVLPSQEALWRDIRVEPGFLLGFTLTRYTREAGDVKERGYRECSVCAKLPALIHVDGNNISSLASSLGVPRSMFTRGESLCPYCLVKRLMTIDKALTNVMNSLGLYTSKTRGIYPRVPSTGELASMDWMLGLADKLAEDVEALKKLEEILKDGAGEASETLESYIDQLDVSDIVNKLEIRNKLKKVMSSLEAERELSQAAAAGKLLSVEVCRDTLVEEGLEADKAEAVCSVVVEKTRRLAKEGVTPSRYYVIVRGDGDFFGKRVVRGILDLSAGEYVKKVMGVLQEASAENQGLLDEFARELACNAKCLASLAERLLGRKSTVPLTPAYYMALSRGQMITALLDAEIVRALGGLPVYAGGDDVAALMPGSLSAEHSWRLLEAWRKRRSPLKRSLPRLWGNVKPLFPGAEAVLLTRLNYWGLLGSHPGFHVTPIGSVYAAPAAYGRSYGLLTAHYRDPFKAAWDSAGLLEELKDGARVYSGAGKVEKDMVFASYGRVTGHRASLPPAAALTNSEPGLSKDRPGPGWRRGSGARVAAAIEDAILVAEATLQGALSTSVYGDFTRECNTAEALARQSALEAAAKLARLLVARNTPRDGEEAASPILEELQRLASIVVKGPNLECSPAPLAWHVLLAARSIRSARR